MARIRIALSALFLALATATSLLAQATENYKVDVDLNTNQSGGNFFGQPWVWIVGGAVFILLLVALLRSGRKDD